MQSEGAATAEECLRERQRERGSVLGPLYRSFVMIFQLAFLVVFLRVLRSAAFSAFALRANVRTCIDGDSFLCVCVRIRVSVSVGVCRGGGAISHMNFEYIGYIFAYFVGHKMNSFLFCFIFVLFFNIFY